MRKEDFINRTLKGGHYVEKELGAGGFGVVYEGIRLQDRKKTAIKILLGGATPQQLVYFQREAAALSQLQHPHIVQFYSHDIEDVSLLQNQGQPVVEQYPFIVMAFANKGTLRHLVPHRRQLDAAQTVNFIDQAAQGVQKAHNEKILHRDLKPENLLLHKPHPQSNHLDLWVTDFGITITAHATSSLSSQTVIGTASYMAPEHIHGQAVPASDQYSLGIITFEMLIGVRPFEGAPGKVMVDQIMTPPPSFKAALQGGSTGEILDAVEEVVMRALDKDSHKRYPSVSDYVDDLKEKYMKGEDEQKKNKRGFPQAPIAPTQPVVPNPIVPLPHIPHQPPAGPNIMVPPLQPPIPGRQGVRLPPISRRTLLIAGLGIAAGGGITWLIQDAIHKEMLVARLHPEKAPGTTIMLYQGHTAPVDAIWWSPDEDAVASGGKDGKVNIWDPATGETKFTYDIGEPVASLTWLSNQNNIMIVGGNGTINIIDATTGSNKQHYKIKFADAGATGLALSPKGTDLIFIDDNYEIWQDAQTGKITSSTPDPQGHHYSAVAWSPDGSHWVEGYKNGQIIAYNNGNGQNEDGKPISAIAISNDGSYVAYGESDGTIQIKDISAPGDPVGKLKLTYPTAGSVNYLAFSPDGKFIASASEGDNNAIRVWRTV